MEMTIKRADLHGALTIAASVATRKGTIPILANVLLQATARDKLLIAASDLAISYVSTVPCVVSGDLALAIDARALVGIVGSLPTDEVKLKVDGSKVEIRGGKSRFELGSLPAKDFPRLPETSSQVFSEVEAAALRSMIDATAFCCTDADGGPLSGINLEFGEEGRLMACDRAHGARSLGKLGTVKMRAALVPRLALSTIMKAFAGSPSVEVAVSPAELFMRSGPTLMVAKVVDAAFPATAPEFFRDDSDHYTTCDRARLIAALRRMVLVASKDHGAKTRLAVTTDSMKLAADGAGFGIAEDEIEVSYFGDGWDKHFDAQLLVESLETMYSDEVVLAVNDVEMAPMVVTPVDENSTQRVIIMPMRAE